MGKQGTSIVWLLVLMLLLVSCGQPNRASEAGPDGITVRISSSDYGEVEILAEMVKALIENETDHKVERILNMTDFISFAAMGQGDLDMYTTFTGTQFMGTLEQELTPEWRDPIRFGSMCMNGCWTSMDIIPLNLMVIIMCTDWRFQR
jgi:osmoprotectant transport system substrate-binding protein